MLAETTPLPVLYAPDLEQAKAFYGEVLGLELVEEADHELRFSAGTGGIIVALDEGVEPPESTAVTWPVEDLEEVVGELRSAGVAFESFGLPGHSGVVELGRQRVAWFKDPAGNVLCLAEGADGGPVAGLD